MRHRAEHDWSQNLGKGLSGLAVLRVVEPHHSHTTSTCITSTFRLDATHHVSWTQLVSSDVATCSPYRMIRGHLDTTDHAQR